MTRISARVVLAALCAAAALTIERPRGAYPSGDDAERWFISQRAYPRSEIPADVMERAEPAVRALAKSRAALALSRDTWVSIGPQPITDPATRYTFAGRVSAIVPHPTDPNVIYLGADR